VAATEQESGTRMRTLVIAGEYPWPENSGSRMRLMTTVSALGALGPTELFSIVPRGRRDIGPPQLAGGLAKVGHTTYDQGSRWPVAALVRPWLPFSLPIRDRPAVRAALAAFISGDYDLVWYFGLGSWLLAGEVPSGPAVLDLDDLEDRKIRARLAIPGPEPGSAAERVRIWAATRYSEEEARRWSRLRDRAARHVRTLVVCSQLDADRLDGRRPVPVSVVPNGYPLVDVPTRERPAAAPPVVLFQGTLRYPPNADAARFLVEDIGPALRRRVPGARIRLVGLTTPALAGLDDPPDVTLAGQVLDLGLELATADLVLVPIRFGSGTRVKIIEAFAHRVPVVSTTLGAEGLGAVHGEHLLIADDAAELAAACERLLVDDALRSRIVESAYGLFVEHLQRDRAEDAVRAVAHRATSR
jgi:glycosyltransferase involved in cell wall biosynthesis